MKSRGKSTGNVPGTCSWARILFLLPGLLGCWAGCRPQPAADSRLPAADTRAGEPADEQPQRAADQPSAAVEEPVSTESSELVPPSLDEMVDVESADELAGAAAADLDDRASGDQSPSAGGPPRPTNGLAEPLLQGIDDRELLAAYQFTRQVLRQPEATIPADMRYVAALQAIAAQHREQGRMGRAHQALLAAATHAQAAIGRADEVPHEAASLLATVFYNTAAAEARAGRPAGAANWLDSAAEWGYSDFELLERDEELGPLRAATGYAQRLNQWRQVSRQASDRLVDQALATAVSFPFNFELSGIDGKAVNLEDFRGQVVVVNIWGTWCPPSHAEVPYLVRLQDLYGPLGLQILGLNDQEPSADGVRDYVAGQAINYPCALIDDATREQIPQLIGYPTTLFLDRAGKVRLKIQGIHEYGFFESMVSRLLAE